MNKTNLTINIEAKGSYTEQELQYLSEQICNFLSGHDGSGIVVGTKYDKTDKTFEIAAVDITKPSESIWGASWHHKPVKI